MKKFENIQALRGIAVLAVVLFHLAGVERKCWGTHTLLPSFSSGNAGVDLFFVISGFVMTVVTRNQFQSSTGISHFIYHRLTRIFPLYWIFTTFFLVIHWVFPTAVAAIPSSIDFLWQSYFLWPQNSPPLLMNGWTLIHEMYFYFVITTFLFFAERNFIKLLLLWGTVLSIGSLFFCVTQQSLRPCVALILHPLTLEFIAGCMIAKLTDVGMHRYTNTLLFFGLLLFLWGAPLCNHLLPNPLESLQDGWRRVAVFGIPSITLVYAAVILEYQKKFLPIFLRRIGNYSYSIYLSHIFILSACGRLFAKIPIQSPLIHIGFAIAALAGVYVAGKYSYLYLERPLLDSSRKGLLLLSDFKNSLAALFSPK